MLNFLDGPRPLYLHTLTLPATLRLLVLAPHPDDFDAISVTLRRFQDRGCRIYLAVLTSGASGVEDSFVSPPTWQRKTEVRQAEQRASCRFFGLPEERLRFLLLAEDEDGHLRDTPENQDVIQQVITSLQPDLVFLPHGNDPNPDHQRTFTLMRRIARQMEQPPVALLNRDPKTIQMRTDLVTLFGESEARWKAQMLRLHQSQQERNLRTRGLGFDERILAVDRQSAAEHVGAGLLRQPPGLDRNKAGSYFAETFEIERFT